MKRIIKKIRTKLWTKFALRKVIAHGKVFVNKKSFFTNKTLLGDNCHFNGIKITGNGNVRIGNNFHSGGGCLIITSNHNYEGRKIPYDDTLISKDVVIEDNVWIGENVTILGGVTIGEGTVIQAGSVVVKNIPKCAIAGGHPATVFKYRDKEHYDLLKSMHQYF